MEKPKVYRYEFWHRHDYWFFKHFCHFCTWKDEINWSLIKRFIHCYYNLQFKRKNILEPLNSHFGSGRFRMTLTFLLIFLNSCAIEQVCFTTLVVLYTQQVYVSQPLWYCILFRYMFHNPCVTVKNKAFSSCLNDNV